MNVYIRVKSREVSYLFVENFSKIGKDLRLPRMHHPENGRNVFYPTHSRGVKTFKLSETLLQSRLMENEDVA